MSTKQLETRHGVITFPTFMPVTTFGGKYPLDDLIRPYLGRFAQCIMVSYHYAKQIKVRPTLPLFIDSGGFASLFEDSEIVTNRNYASIKTKEGDLISPPDVLAFQEKYADIGATLDFIISPGIDLQEAKYRQELTLKNAVWAIENHKSTDLKLFASVQAWDKRSAQWIMERLADYPFDGFALGGMVPRIKDSETVISIIKSIRNMDSDRPLHVFGIGQPALMQNLFSEGVSSTDSSSFLKATANKQFLDPVSFNLHALKQLGDDNILCDCSVCGIYKPKYFHLSGETNNLALALHNLSVTRTIISSDIKHNIKNGI